MHQAGLWLLRWGVRSLPCCCETLALASLQMARQREACLQWGGWGRWPPMTAPQL